MPTPIAIGSDEAGFELKAIIIKLRKVARIGAGEEAFGQDG